MFNYIYRILRPSGEFSDGLSTDIVTKKVVKKVLAFQGEPQMTRKDQDPTYMHLVDLYIPMKDNISSF